MHSVSGLLSMFAKAVFCAVLQHARMAAPRWHESRGRRRGRGSRHDLVRGGYARLVVLGSAFTFATVWTMLEPAESPSVSRAYYPNCAAARSAGAAPIRAGEPGYREALDADDDGVACEPYARW